MDIGTFVKTVTIQATAAAAASAKAAKEEELKLEFLLAGEEFRAWLDNEMRNEILEKVYNAYAPEEYARTYSYLGGWSAEKSGADLTWNVNSKWHALGGHTSYTGENVDGYLDSLIIDGHGGKPEMAGRDHISELDARVETKAREILAAHGFT